MSIGSDILTIIELSRWGCQCIIIRFGKDISSLDFFVCHMVRVELIHRRKYNFDFPIVRRGKGKWKQSRSKKGKKVNKYCNLGKQNI